MKDAKQLLALDAASPIVDNQVEEMIGVGQGGVMRMHPYAGWRKAFPGGLDITGQAGDTQRTFPAELLYHGRPGGCGKQRISPRSTEALEKSSDIRGRHGITEVFNRFPLYRLAPSRVGIKGVDITAVGRCKQGAVTRFAGLEGPPGMAGEDK